MRRFDTFSELQEIPVHKCIGPAWADSHQTHKNWVGGRKNEVGGGHHIIILFARFVK